MLRLDELETLSRLSAGDLSPHEAAQLRADLERRPELAAALEQLTSLNRAAEALPQTIGASELEMLVARVARPRRNLIEARFAITAGLAAAALVVVAALLSFANREPRPRLVALSGSVRLDGRALSSPSQAIALQSGSVVDCGAESASIIESRQAMVLLARESELALISDAPATFALQRGTLAATGPAVHLAAGDARFELNGRGVLSWEPEDELVRVTSGMETKEPAKLGFKWLRLPVAATAAAVGAVTLFVLEGRARVTLDSTAPVEVAAGQKWSSGSTRPSPIATSAALTASAETVDSNPNQKTASSVKTTLETLSRDQLVSEVKRLKGENATLSQQNKEMQKRLHELDPKTAAQTENFYRTTPEELRARAEHGEVRLHPPALIDEGSHTFNPDLVRDVGLQPSEEAEIRNIYARSNQRLQDGLTSIYIGIGGDANVASTLDISGLLHEIGTKTPRQDVQAAGLIASRERAGLEQPSNPNEGSGVLRAYRLFWREEDQVLQELDQLLGPDRAEQFINHRNMSHNTIATRVRP